MDDGGTVSGRNGVKTAFSISRLKITRVFSMIRRVRNARTPDDPGEPFPHPVRIARHAYRNIYSTG